MASVEIAFLFVAIIIIAGFFGGAIFKKTKISDVLLLMLLGLLIGPVFNILGNSTVVLFKSIAPFFAALVLVMLLFESGLKLNFFKVVRELKVSFVFTILVFALSMIITALIMSFLGWSFFQGLILGAIIGGTSSAIVIGLVNKTGASQETKIMLSLESAITDSLCIIITIALIQIALSASINPQQLGQDILGAFAIAAFLGALIAIVWLALLRDLKAVKERQYILTIAALFFVFFIAEFFKSNGAIAALVFGLVLGNSREIMDFLRMREISLDSNISLFQEEISFFIRTFFFIYIGIIFDAAIPTNFVIIAAVLLVIGMLGARATITKAMLRFLKNERKDSRLITAMVPRGLAAAVLAAYPLSFGLNGGFGEQTVQIVFLVILFSNIVTSIGVLISEKGAEKEKKPREESSATLEEIKIKELREKIK